MPEKVIPHATRLAAKRGFIRTATQALAVAIPVSAVTIPLSGDALIGAGLAAASVVVGALFAGSASALSIISNGIPADYVEAAVQQAADAENEAYEFGGHPSLYPDPRE